MVRCSLLGVTVFQPMGYHTKAIRVPTFVYRGKTWGGLSHGNEEITAWSPALGHDEGGELEWCAVTG